MSTLKLALALLQVVRGLLAWVEKRDIEDATIAREALKSLRQADETIEKARKAANEAFDAPIDGDGDGVPDDDGHRID